MPHPCRVVPSRVFPSQQSRAPLGAASSLVVIYPRAETSYPKPCHRPFPWPPPLATWLPTSPDDYGLPFGMPRRASRSPWTSGSGVTSYRRLHPLRSLVPPANPFAPAQISPEPEVDTLLGFCPSGAFSSHASDSRPAGPQQVRTNIHLRSQASHLPTLRGESTSSPLDHIGARLRRPLSLSSQVRPSGDQPKTASSTDTSPLQTGLPRR
jgi:hypothetical protein